MKLFRLHITRIFSVGFLLAGMMLYFMKPVNNNTKHDAFTLWLQSHLKASTNADIANQIRSLSSEEDKELESLIRRASELVKAHADDFKIPVNPDTRDVNEVYNVLLKEWNNYQQSSSGMGKAVLIKQSQPHSILPIDGLAFNTNAIAQKHDIVPSTSNTSFEPLQTPLLNYRILPLSGGMAIGAP